MNPADYKGTEWAELLKRLDSRQVKNALRGAARREAKKATAIAQQRLMASGLHVKGNAADWKKGVRHYVYPPRYGLGFLVTAKARAASRKTGKGEKSMHKNRAGLRKPVLMWAEDGTAYRKTKTKTRCFIRRKKGHSTGKMPAYHFIEEAMPQMFKQVEAGILPDIDAAVKKQAAKAGFT